jgi:hypothetical protein
MVIIMESYAAYENKILFIEAPFQWSGFSSNGLFIGCTIVCNFQNCKQNFCSTSASKVIDDLVTL